VQSELTALLMTRKDSEKDSERPHYYSQFWLDIAAGRRTIGGPKPDDGEAIEAETAEPVLQHRPGQISQPETFHKISPLVNGYQQEEVVHPVADEEYNEPEEDLSLDEEDLIDGDYQADLPLDDEDVPDVDLSSEEEETATGENELLDYDDEDAEWDTRNRKKAKPTRPSKAPAKKPGKPRRGSY
jgi:hypothetical protein